MRDQLVVVFVTFLLTTIAGGWFQHVTWRRRRDIEQREVARNARLAAFEDVARLLDRRLFRTKRWWWALAADPLDFERVERERSAYDGLLEEWNATLNRNLALVQAWWGDDARDSLDDLHRQFRDAGRHVQHGYRHLRDGGSPPDDDNPEWLAALDDAVLNVTSLLARVMAAPPPPSALTASLPNRARRSVGALPGNPGASIRRA